MAFCLVRAVVRTMCRILAVVPRGPLPPSLLRDFGVLATYGDVFPDENPGHHDGWGLAVARGGAWEYLGREPLSAAGSVAFAAAVERAQQGPPPEVLIAHLRAASQGKVTLENTHPFLKEKWAFCHNGTIYGLKLPQPGMVGQTDSEWLMMEVLNEVGEGTPASEAFAATLRQVRARYPHSSLTSVLSDGRSLWVARVIGRSQTYTDEQLHSYYGMWHARTADSVMVCQQPLVGFDWVELDDSKLLEVRPDLTTSIEPI